MKTLITCMLCAAALTFSANVNAQEAPAPSAVVPCQMTLTVSVDGEVNMVLPPTSGKWDLQNCEGECPVDVAIDTVAVKDKKSGAVIEGESDIVVTIKGRQEGKAVLQFVAVNGNGIVVDSRTVAIEVVK